MSAILDLLQPDKPKKILMIVANPATNRWGGKLGFWASELTHPYYEFVEHGYQIEIRSPDGGKVEIDEWSDPGKTEYSAWDLISMGFLHTPKLMALLEDTRSIDDVKLAEYDAIFLCGGTSPMYTFIDNEKLHKLFAEFYEAGKVAAALCHGTCILLKTRLSNGKLLAEGKTWTGFAEIEEQFGEKNGGWNKEEHYQPFWIEEEARKLPTNFISAGLWKRFAVRDGNLITGQQQYSGGEAAKLVITALGQ
jgi:putative intracellular protease/amidase